ncbi:MAG: zinc-binding dehydrogenase [Chitinivibrionales bacterium]|nr:zinc-binding dehydrogenase [Chitinivibrionales bacterium]
MRAMVTPKFGSPDLFELKDIEKPSPGPGELLVRVVASGTNPVEAKIRKTGYWGGIKPPVILGYDVSGIVEQVGDGVNEFVNGDEVFYTPEIDPTRSGSYAEYNVVAASIVTHKPSSLSHIEAAAVPLAGGTAYEAIIRRLRISIGETILIHGGAGGVGSFAVQLARGSGARVLATASKSNQETLHSLGVDVAIDYANQDPFEIALKETGGRGVDAVFDTVGGDIIQRSLAATRPFGRLAGILGPGGDLTQAYRKNCTYYGVMLTRERKRLEILKAILEQRKISPLIDRIIPLEKVSEAHHRLDSGHGRGKIVLKIGK